MKFLHPEMAIWLLALPVFFCFWSLNYWYKRHVRSRFSAPWGVGTIARIPSWKRDFATLGLNLVLLTALVLTLMRPQVFLKQRNPEYEREDLILLLDRSLSMNAEDVRPSRFARAILEIKNFLRRKPPEIERVGLVGFSGTSVILSYLTRDVDSILFYLDWVQEDRRPSYGTDFGRALNSGREIARKDNVPGRKIFLLLSDGEDQGTELTKAVDTFRAEGNRVYCIGIGSQEDAVIPMPTGFGEVSFLQDDQGTMVTTRFDETTLRSIANMTGGRYFRSVTGAEMEKALSVVAEREQRILGWKETSAYRDVYLWLLLCAGVAAIGLSIIL